MSTLPSCIHALRKTHVGMVHPSKGTSAEATGAAFTTFMGHFRTATNTLSFLLSFLGTSAIIQKLGLGLTLSQSLLDCNHRGVISPDPLYCLYIHDDFEIQFLCTE